MPLKYQNDGAPPPHHPIHKSTAKQPMGATHEPMGADKYHGAVADNYDAKRANQPKQQFEQQIIETAIGCMKPGSIILDVPVGTGRFIPKIASMGHQLIGIDISEAMLDKAKAKIPENMPAALAQSSVWETNLKDQSVHMSIMCRLTRWLSPEKRHLALQELQRVTTDIIVFTARVDNHPHAYPLEAINRSVNDDWAACWVYNMEEDPDYWVMSLARRTSGWFQDGQPIDLMQRRG